MLLCVPEIEFLGGMNTVIIRKKCVCFFLKIKHYSNMELSLRLNYSD